MHVDVRRCIRLSTAFATRALTASDTPAGLAYGAKGRKAKWGSADVKRDAVAKGGCVVSDSVHREIMDELDTRD